MNCRLPKKIGAVSAGWGFTTLAEMFAGAEAYNVQGRNASSTGTVRMTGVPTSGLYYALSLCNGEIGAYKLKDGVLTELFRSSTKAGGLRIQSTTIYYSATGGSNTSVYGATIALISFPLWQEEHVDAALSSMTVAAQAGRNSSSTGRVALTSANCTPNDVVFVGYQMYMSVYKGSTITSSSAMQIVFDATEGYQTAGSYNTTYGLQAYSSNVYGGSVIAVNSTGIPSGGGGSGGGSTGSIPVTISGTGKANLCCVEINGTQYTSSATTAVNAGDKIWLAVYGTGGISYTGRLTINGTQISSADSGASVGTWYEWTVPTGTNTITIQMSLNVTSTQSQCGNIAVVTS